MHVTVDLTRISWDCSGPQNPLDPNDWHKASEAYDPVERHDIHPFVADDGGPADERVSGVSYSWSSWLHERNRHRNCRAREPRSGLRVSRHHPRFNWRRGHVHGYVAWSTDNLGSASRRPGLQHVLRDHVDGNAQGDWNRNGVGRGTFRRWSRRMQPHPVHSSPRGAAGVGDYGGPIKLEHLSGAVRRFRSVSSRQAHPGPQPVIWVTRLT